MNNTHKDDANMKDKNVTMVIFPKYDFQTIQKAMLFTPPNFSDYATNKKDGAHIENKFCTAGPIYTEFFPECYKDLCFAIFLTKPHNCDFDYDKFVKDLNIDHLVVINKSLDGDKKVIYFNDQINEFSGTDYYTSSHKPSSQFDNAARSLLAAKIIIDTELEMCERGECKTVKR